MYHENEKEEENKLDDKKIEKEILQNEIGDLEEDIAEYNAKRRKFQEQLDNTEQLKNENKPESKDGEESQNKEKLQNKKNRDQSKLYADYIEKKVEEYLKETLKDFEEKVKKNEASQLVKIIKIELENDEINYYHLTALPKSSFKQSFRINAKTTFKEIIDSACSLWNISTPSDLTLVDQKDGDISTEYNSYIEDFFQRALSNQQDEPIFKLKRKQKEHSLLEKGSEKNSRDENARKLTELWRKTINDDYPGLLFYQSETEIESLNKKDNTIAKEEEISKDKQVRVIIEDLDSSFCGVLLVLIIIILTILGISTRYNISDQRWVIHSLNQTLSPPVDIIYDYDNYLEYPQQMSTICTLSRYLIKMKSVLFGSDQNSISAHFYYLSKINLRFMATRSKPCINSNSFPGFTCYYSDVNADTVDTNKSVYFANTISSSISNSFVFLDNISRTLTGTFGEYQGYGHSIAFDPATDMDLYEKFVNEFINSEDGCTADSKFFEQGNRKAIRAIEISFSVFNPNSILACNINILIERSTNGRMLYKPLSFNPFKLTIFEKNYSAFTVEVIKLLFSCYFIICIKQLITSVKPLKKGGYNPYKSRPIIFHISLDAFNVMLIISNIVFDWYISRNLISDTIQTLNANIDEFSGLESQTTVSLTLSCINLIIMVYRLIKCMKIYSKIAFIVAYIENVFGYLVIYFVCLLPLLLSLSFMLMGVWGPFCPEYTSFSYSLISTMLMMVGKIDVYKLLAYNPRFGLIYIILIFLVSYYFLYIALFSAHVSEYQNVIRIRGYPEDRNDEFKMNNVLNWILKWVPFKIRTRINIRDNTKDENGSLK